MRLEHSSPLWKLLLFASSTVLCRRRDLRRATRPPTLVKQKGRLFQATLSLKLDAARDDSGDACSADRIIVIISAQYPLHPTPANIPQNSIISLVMSLSVGLRLSAFNSMHTNP